MDGIAKEAPGSRNGASASRRTEERIRASLRLVLPGGGCGTTRDISPSGVFFRTSNRLREGDPIQFSVLFEDPPSRKWKLACHGWVVRIEGDGNEAGVAARIVESKFEVQR